MPTLDNNHIFMDEGHSGYENEGHASHVQSFWTKATDGSGPKKALQNICSAMRSACGPMFSVCCLKFVR